MFLADFVLSSFSWTNFEEVRFGNLLQIFFAYVGKNGTMNFVEAIYD
jgi:hypothetical protein